jgi:hypothetical protein
MFVIRKAIAAAGVSLLIALAGQVSTVSAQANYGCGTYGAGSYEENCANTSGGTGTDVGTGSDTDKDNGSKKNNKPDDSDAGSTNNGLTSDDSKRSLSDVLRVIFFALIATMGVGWFLFFFWRRRKDKKDENIWTQP